MALTSMHKTDMLQLITNNVTIYLSYEKTPLHYAARNNAADAIDILVKKGANINCIDYVAIYIC